MTQRELEQKLAQAVGHAQPELLDRVLTACAESSKGADEPMKEPNNTMHPAKKRHWPVLAAAMLALVLVGGAIGWQLGAARVPVARVALDVNPSVEFTLNRKDQLLEVTPCNPEGEALVAGMQLERAPLDEALDTLVTGLHSQGYLQPTGSTLLISVDADGTNAAALQQHLTQQVRQLADANTLKVQILSQQVPLTEALGQTARAWDTSFGRAAYYTKIAEAAQLDASQMAGLTVQQAEYLLQSRGLTMDQAGVELEVDDDLTQTDLVGKSLLPAEDALSQALAAAGVDRAAAWGPEVELDAEAGQLVYEVEFKAGGREYEFTLDAATGKVLHQSSEPDDDAPGAAQSAQAAYSPDEAVNKALAAAGVDRAAAREIEADLEDEGGQLVYEVDFKAGGREYEFTLDAATGKVLHQNSEPDDDAAQGAQAAYSPDEAVNKALAAAGVGRAAAREIEADLEDEGGQLVYEVAFKAGGREYEVTLDAATGKVLHQNSEPDDDVPDAVQGAQAAYSPDEAVNKALVAAGVGRAAAREIEADLEDESSQLVYEVGFKAGGREYEVTLDAATGKVLHQNSEPDDDVPPAAPAVPDDEPDDEPDGDDPDEPDDDPDGEPDGPDTDEEDDEPYGDDPDEEDDD